MITVTDLSKSFAGNNVINHLNLEIDSGEITALVGKNGAGKSTLVRLISGLLKVDGGDIKIEGNADVGVLLGGDISLYGSLTAYEIIKFFGAVRGLDSESIDSTIDELDKTLNFKSFLNKRCNTFSRGMRQKIGFVISIIHNPDVLLLDEPSTGLDIEASNDVIDFIHYLKQTGKTILIATHNIFEISDLSDSIAFLNGGKIKQKVKTGNFFNGCPIGGKNELLIRAMNEEINL